MYHSLSYFVAGCLAAAGALTVSLYRKAPGAKSFIVICLLAAWSAFSACLEFDSASLEVKLLWHNMQQTATFLIPSAFVVLALACLRGERFNVRRTSALLLVLPVIALGLLYTEPNHGLMRTSVLLDGGDRLLIERTWLFNLFLAYNGAALLGGFTILFRAAAAAGSNRRAQLVLLTAGLLAALPACLASGMSDLLFRGYAGFMAMTFVVGGLLIAAALLRFRLFQSAPIARNQLVDIVADGIVVLDGEGRILDQNEAAKQILTAMSGAPARQLLGQSLIERLPSFEPLFREYARSRYATAELIYGDPDKRRTISATLKPVSTGAVLTLRDITELLKLEREWKARALTDGLTGISNRTGFYERIEQLWESASPEEPISLLLLDIDHFKSVNDRFGHQTGDEAIRAFVASVLGVIAMPYVFGRIGGEEFALALPGRNRRQAYETAERIREAVERTCHRTEDGIEVRCTVSIGIACRTEEDDTFDRVFAKADQSLYKAKQNGRNQTQSA